MLWSFNLLEIVETWTLKAYTVSTASMKFNEETKVRDEKYAELDAKFNRLLKRSKQRIQEVQKVWWFILIPLMSIQLVNVGL